MIVNELDSDVVIVFRDPKVPAMQNPREMHIDAKLQDSIDSIKEKIGEKLSILNPKDSLIFKLSGEELKNDKSLADYKPTYSSQFKKLNNEFSKFKVYLSVGLSKEAKKDIEDFVFVNKEDALPDTELVCIRDSKEGNSFTTIARNFLNHFKGGGK